MFLALARSNPHSWYGRVNCWFGPPFYVDSSFRRTLENNIRPRTPIWVKTIRSIMPVTRHQAFAHDGLLSRVQQDGRAIASTTESSKCHDTSNWVEIFLWHRNTITGRVLFSRDSVKELSKRTDQKDRTTTDRTTWHEENVHLPQTRVITIRILG